MKTFYCILFTLLTLSPGFIFSQDIEYQVMDPFISSYQDNTNHTLFSFSDIAVYTTNWGYVIFGNEDDEFTEFSRIYVDSYPAVARYGNTLFAYCNYNSNDQETYSIIEIDISNPQEPVVNEFIDLEKEFSWTKLFVFDHYLYIADLWDNTYKVIDIESPENQVDYYLQTNDLFLAGNYILSQSSAELYECYQHSDNGLELVFSNLNIAQAHGDQNINNIIKVKEGIAASITNESVVFWDTSDPSNWESGDYWEIDDSEYFNSSGDALTYDDKLYINSSISLYEFEFNENNQIENVSSYDFPYEYYANTLGLLDNILLIPVSAGIAMYEISDQPELTGYYHQWSSLSSYTIMGDEYIAFGHSGDLEEGIYHADISNPLEPEFLPNLLEGEEYSLMRTAGNYFYLNYFSNEMRESFWDIYRYEEGNMQFLQRDTYENFEDVFNKIIYDPFEPDAYYIFNQQLGIFRKYVVENNIPELMMDEDVIGKKCGFIRNGFAYFITRDGDLQDIYIYSGLEENSFIEAEHYVDFIPGEYCYLRYIDEDYLLVSNSNVQYVMQFEGAEIYPEFSAISSFLQNISCKIDNYIVSTDDKSVYFYEMIEEGAGYMQQELEIKLLHSVYKVEHYQNESGNYLFCSSNSATSVIEIEIVNNSIDWEIITPNTNVVCYPNPFSQNENTTISFAFDTQDSRSEEKYNIEVYNIKGQIVHEDEFTSSSGRYSWNLIEHKKLGSGIYLYSISGKDFFGKGKIILTR